MHRVCKRKPIDDFFIYFIIVYLFMWISAFEYLIENVDIYFSLSMYMRFYI